ncbi:hypothetical protein L218DRAFT_228168 [Marasmius fiardii PR-910]|nr:hypothetical protein L218DRAFT_228168 [Marasmius fiardii PR-910]
MNNLYGCCFVTAIADAMLIHRCCIIWQSGIMMYLLGSVAVILNGIYIGCTIAGVIAWSTSNFSLYIRASIIFNATGLAIAVFQVILALLTGGRIWWISREARRLMGRSTNRKYNSITAIIIESGMLYAGFQISSNVLLFIIDPTDSAGLFPIDLSPLAGLMAGLAPTLIIVRVAYGKSVDSVQQMVSTLQITSPEENSQRSRPGDDLQLRTQIGGYVQSVSETPLPVPAMSEEMA